jgi:hypothetical protein
MPYIENSEQKSVSGVADRDSKNVRELLRQEIVESEKSQADFLKWKLIVVAAIGSVSLGFTSSTGSSSARTQSLLCFIPLICLYVDLISLHIMSRVRTIGAFLKETGSDYEKFVFAVRARANPFGLESFALQGSSFLLNGILVILGVVALIVYLVARSPTPAATATAVTAGAASTSATAPFEWVPAVLVAYIITGLSGIFSTYVLLNYYQIRDKEVDQFAKEYISSL